MARKLSRGQKGDRVMQAAGYRMACLEMLPLVKDAEVRSEIVRRGEWADQQIIEHGGMVLIAFKEAVNRDA